MQNIPTEQFNLRFEVAGARKVGWSEARMRLPRWSCLRLGRPSVTGQMQETLGARHAATVLGHSLYSLVEGASGFANRVDLGATQE